MAAVFRRAFPEEADADWVAALPVAVLDGIGDLVRQGEQADNAETWSALSSRCRRRSDDPGQPCPGDRPVAARPPAHGHGAPARYAVRGNRVGRPRLRRGGVRIGTLRGRGSRGEELRGALRARAVRRHRTPRELRRFDRPRVPARARAAVAATDVGARRTLRTHGARPARRRAIRGRADPRERQAGQRALAAAGKPEAHDPAHRRVRAQDRRSLHHARRQPSIAPWWRRRPSAGRSPA